MLDYRYAPELESKVISNIKLDYNWILVNDESKVKSHSIVFIYEDTDRRFLDSLFRYSDIILVYINRKIDDSLKDFRSIELKAISDSNRMIRYPEEVTLYLESGLKTVINNEDKLLLKHKLKEMKKDNWYERYLCNDGQANLDDTPKDIVYVLKNDVRADELRYSLRSVVKNFKFNRIFFYGGCPKNIHPDVYVNYEQSGKTKYARTRGMFKSIFTNNDITEDFWLFNDDFFILRPVDKVPYIIDGTVQKYRDAIRKRYGRDSVYTIRLSKSIDILEKHELDTLNYECHVPMLINRNKGRRLLRVFDDDAIFRSTYGNYFKVGGMIQKDVKIISLKSIPENNDILLSTSDESFKHGKVGKYIKDMFNGKCRYEEEV